MQIFCSIFSKRDLAQEACTGFLQSSCKQKKTALATNESDDSEGDGEDKNDNRLTLDDEDSETDCTGAGMDDFTASIEGSTIGLKDDLESMRDESSEDRKRC